VSGELGERILPPRAGIAGFGKRVARRAGSPASRAGDSPPGWGGAASAAARRDGTRLPGTSVRA
jgi:hypothetical protein